MKLKTLFLVLAGLWLALTPARSVRAAEVSFDFFFDSLAPYGDWLEVGDYGYCWRPSGVDRDWSPYADGYWAYTDAGWTWVSYEDYGGIVYHYGRWVKVEDEGWCWVPDYQWGPAWVSWRHSDDYIGWAPLPPEARWERNRGFSVWVDSEFDIAPVCFNFCHSYDFGAPVLRPVIINRTENFVIVNQTVNITNVTYNSASAVVFDGGPSYAAVRRFARQPVPALKLVRNENIGRIPGRGQGLHAIQKGNQLVVLAPAVARPQPAQMAVFKSRVTKVVPQAKVTRGWAGVNPAERTAVQAKLKQDAKGLTAESAPAKPPQAADLAVVPTKADPKAKLPTAAALPKVPGASGRPEHMTAEPGTPGRAPGAESPAAIAEREKHAGGAAKGAEAPGAPNLIKPFNPKTAAQEGNPGAERTQPATAAEAHKAAAAEAAQKRAEQMEAAREKAAPAAAAAEARKNAAAEAGQKHAAELEAAHQKSAAAALEKRQQAAESAAAMERNQEAAKERASAAANARNAELANARERAAEAAHAKAAENAAMTRERAAEAANARARAPQEAAVARERAAEASAARERLMEQKTQAVERQQPVERPRVAPVPQPKVIPQAPRPVAPPANQKRKLTPEEAAAAARGQ